MPADGNNHISALAYDASGNATSDGAFAHTWDAESQMKTAAGVTYTYDGDGRRVMKSNGKIYWYGSGGDTLAETDASGNTLNEYIFFGGKRIAMLPSGSSPLYYLEDFLGTSRVITDSSGVPCYDADFDPFGGEHAYTNSCPQNYKFEGKERDTETGNDDFGARYYSNRFGRWLSADWSSVPVPVPYANLTNPQTLNLYAMVADDPKSLADPDGHGHNAGEVNVWNFDPLNDLWLVKGAVWSPNGGTPPITVNENVIWNQNSNNGRGLTSTQKAHFGRMQEETEELFGQANIQFSVTYTDGSMDRDERGFPSAIYGAVANKLNVFVVGGALDRQITGSVYATAGSSTIQWGKAFTFIGLSEAEHWTLSHEFAHHFLGNTQGKVTRFQYLVGETYIKHFVLRNIPRYADTLRYYASKPIFGGQQ
jgi:RHS repeat-associated protein